jgi:hypothetical protein
VLKATSSIERKPKKIVLNNTTGVVTQAPSPSHNYKPAFDPSNRLKEDGKHRFNSEAPSPANKFADI